MTLLRNRIIVTFSTLMLSTAIFTNPTMARNGPLPHGIGTQFNLGGAGSALPIDASNGESNPAILSRVDTQIGAYFINFFQRQSIDATQAQFGNPIGIQTNRLKHSPGGSLSGNYNINPKWSVGLTTSGGGANIKYNSSINNPAVQTVATRPYNNQFINKMFLLSPTVAYQHTPCSSYGLSILLGNQTLRTNLAKSDFSQTSGANRVDTARGVGFRVGGLWDLNHLISLGASASTPVKFGRFNKYRDVIPYSLDVPAMFRLGLALKTSHTDFLFDIKEALFSSVKAADKLLGWKNQTILMFGVQHRLTPCWILGAGYNHGNSPVRKNNVLLNSLSMPIARHHFSAGVRYHATRNIELSAGLEFSPNIQMVDDGTGILGVGARGTRIKNREIGAMLGLVYHFCK